MAKTNRVIKIDKGIPMPTRKECSRLIYPFDKMQVGDSLKINGSDQAKVQRNLVSAVSNYRSRGLISVSLKWKVRQVPGGARIWRIK